MPVFKVESKLAPGLGYDRRFRQWAKLIRSAADIDLYTKVKGGYALTGPFVKWGEAVPLAEGQFLVLSSETGSQARHSASYALIECTGGQAVEVDDMTVTRAVQNASVFTDEQLAKAQNSELYTIACYAWLCFMARMPAGELGPEIARQGLDNEAPTRFLDKIAGLLTGMDFGGVLQFPVEPTTPARRMLDTIFNRDGEQYCPLCDERIRHAERICRRCLDQTIRELDSLDTATACKAAAEYAIQRVTS